MFLLNDIIDKMKDIVSQENGNKKMYDKDIADELHIKHLTFATMKNRNKIPYQEILDFCAIRKLSINWLLYDQVTKSLEDETERFAKVRYFRDIYASAGGGAEDGEIESEFVTLDNMIIDKIGGERELKHIEAINVTGDSMEPTLKDGNMVFINRNMIDISSSGIFVVATDSGMFVKRISLRADGQIDLISDNKSYPVQSVEGDNLRVIGKVVGMVESF